MLKAVVFLVSVPELEMGICEPFSWPCTALAKGLAGRKGFLLGGATSSFSSSSS